MASAKGADSTKSTTFGLFAVFPPFRRSQKREIQQIRRYKINNFWAFAVFPPCQRSQKQEIQQIRRSTKSTTFELLWCSLHFGGPRSRKSSKSEGALEMASAKGAGFTKSTTFGLLWGSLHFGGPRSRKSSKSEGALEMASAKGADSTKSTTFGLL